MISAIQWTPPEDPDKFMGWLKEWHPKWVKGSDEETLVNMLATSDGLGSKIKTKALELIRSKQ